MSESTTHHPSAGKADTVSGQPARGTTQRRRLLRVGAEVGTAAAALLAGVLLFAPGENRGGHTERPPGVGVPGSGAKDVRLLRPLAAPAVVEPGRATFVWESAGEAVIYRFALVAEDGQVAWSTGTLWNSVVMPGKVAAGLAIGRYYWRVDALLPDLTSATTGEQSVRVEP